MYILDVYICTYNQYCIYIFVRTFFNGYFILHMCNVEYEIIFRNACTYNTFINILNKFQTVLKITYRDLLNELARNLSETFNTSERK